MKIGVNWRTQSCPTVMGSPRTDINARYQQAPCVRAVFFNLLAQGCRIQGRDEGMSSSFPSVCFDECEDSPQLLLWPLHCSHQCSLRVSSVWMETDAFGIRYRFVCVSSWVMETVWHWLCNTLSFLQLRLVVSPSHVCRTGGEAWSQDFTFYFHV